MPPSDLYKISDPLTAYCFNRAVMTFGMSLDGEMNKASASLTDAKKAQAARLAVLNSWLEEPGKAGGGQFRDPVKHMSF